MRDLLLKSTEEVYFMDFAKKLAIKDVINFCTKVWNEASSLAIRHAWNKVGLGLRSSQKKRSQQQNHLTAESLKISEECVQLGIDSLEGDVWLDTDVGEIDV